MFTRLHLSRLVGFATASFSASALAVTASYPTQWTLNNNAKTPVALTCNASGKGGVTMTMTVAQVPAKGRHIYDWGRAWYNDGMGLNPGEWSCKAAVEGAGAVDVGTFKTEWGETVELAISAADGQLRVEKLDTAGKMARGEKSRQTEER